MKEDIGRQSQSQSFEALGGGSEFGGELARWIAELGQELAALRSRALFRTLRAHSGRLDFSSNDYLSLNSSGRLDAMLRDLVGGGPAAAETAGDEAGKQPGMVGSTGSRLIRGHYEVFERAEAEFARYVGSPAALLFHSGYAANTGALAAVVGPRDRVFCDRLVHASLLDGIRLSGVRRYYFRHNDLNDLETQLRKYASPHRNWLVTEAVFSMDGDSPDLRALCDLADRYHGCVYLDEAHSIGLVGPRGAGLAAAQGVANRVAVNVFPCGKAPGLMGAFVCGPPELKDLLINRARSFVFTTAQPPLLAELLRRIVGWLQTDEAEAARARVMRTSGEFRAAVQALGYDTAGSTSQIVPIVVGAEDRALELARRCQERGLDVRAIRPPTVPKNTSRLRVILQAAHTGADAAELLAVLEEFAAG